MTRFAAIDFETANHDRASACAVGLTLVESERVVDRIVHLIRPPSSSFIFTHIHGLTWNDVCEAPTFAEVWEDIGPHINGLKFLAAHNAQFDRGVLEACCAHYGIPRPRHKFICTVGLARQQWSIYPTRLSDVCRQLHIPLNHHEAGSDSEACARIVIAARKAGWRPAV